MIPVQLALFYRCARHRVEGPAVVHRLGFSVCARCYNAPKGARPCT